jgi:phage shock protein A
MKYRSRLSLLALSLAAGAAFAQAPQAVVSTTTIAPAPASQAALQRLDQASQRLSDAVRVLANKPAGPERDQALHEARMALARTQQAMREAPRQYRVITSSASTATPPGYDSSVQVLMRAADQLRNSIHAMAREPAGPQRNQAIRDADRALLDTQSAMAQAFDASYASNQRATTTTLGAGPAARTIVVDTATMHCQRLGDMLGCR